MLLLKERCLILYLILYNSISPILSYIGTTYGDESLFRDTNRTTKQEEGEKSTNGEHSTTEYGESTHSENILTESGKSTNNEHTSTKFWKTTKIEHTSTKFGKTAHSSTEFSKNPNKEHSSTIDSIQQNDKSETAVTKDYLVTENIKSGFENIVNSSDTIVTQPSSVIISIATTTTEPDVCAEYGTCKFMSELERVELTYCHCDELCRIYNDCCSDSDFYNKSRGVTKTQFECTRYSNADKYFGIYLINQCPDSFRGAEVDKKCGIDDLLAFGPWVVDEIGMVYQNKFCAECHGKESYISFSVNISNVENRNRNFNDNNTLVLQLEDLMYLVAKKWSRFDLVPPEGISVRYCIIYNPMQYNSSGCMGNYINPVFAPSTGISLFRNKYCIPINGFCIGQQIYRNFSLILELEMTTSAVLPKQEMSKVLFVFAWSVSNLVTTKKMLIGETIEMNNSSFLTRFQLQGVIDKDIKANDMFEYVSNVMDYQLEIIARGTNYTFSTFIAMTPGEVLAKWKIGPKELSSGLRNVKVDTSTYFEFQIDLECIKRFVEIDLRNNSVVSVLTSKCLESIHILGTIHGDNNLVKTVLTFIGMGISVISLIVCIIIYRLAGLYRSVSGSNTENLCISLLLSNVLFLVGVGANDYAYVCYVVGVCLHYLWLLVFSFMSITLVHMSHVFMKMSSVTTSQQTVSDRRLTILGLLLPTPFIASSLVLDLLDVPGFKSNYDGTICFPTGYPASLMFMSGPIGIAIAVNIVCFIFTAFVINNKSRYSKLVRKSNSYQYISVYARICVVTGIFWITGVVGVFYHSEVIEYVFIILCSLQGFFVALSNLTTKRVSTIIRNFVAAKQDTTACQPQE